MSLSSASSLSGTRSVLAVASALIIGMPSLVQAETIATVNGTPIDSSVLDFYIQSRVQQPTSQVSPEQRQSLLDELRDIYLLSTQDAAESIKSDPRVQAQLELQRQSLIAQNVAQKYIADMTVTDEEIQAAYAQQSEMAPPLQFKARHILVESQGEAADIIAELDQGGDFETLAEERSTGPSGPNGGDLGWFSPNQMVAPFSNAVQAMEDGDYSSEPVQTDFGWHVILREGSRDSEAPPLENVRDTIRQQIQQQKFQAYLDELRANASE